MEFDALVVKESPGLCRCCLSEGCYKDLGTEYTWMNDTEVYADMLFECFDISITQHNDGPNGPNRLICEVCITRLRDACNFKKQVLNTEKKFIDMIGRREFKPQMLIYQAQVKNENQVGVIPDGEEVEYLEDDVQFGDDDPKESTDVEEPSMSEDITVSSLPVKGKRGRPRKNAKAKTEKAKVARVEEKKPVKVKDEYQQGPYISCTSERRRKNMTLIFNHTSVMPFKWRGRFSCFYCAKSFVDYVLFRKHTLAHGLCTTKDYALKVIKGNHIEIKIDVSELICEICNDQFEQFSDVIDHLIVTHGLQYYKDVDIPFQEYRLADGKCLLCEETFTYFGHLISHVNTVHPQNSFICNECDLSFNKKRDLACHIRNFHRQGGYPCDQCMQVFETKRTLHTHANNTHYRKCSNCGVRFGSLSLLQKHIQIDHPEICELKCSYCSKLMHSAQGLTLHMSKCKVKLLTQIDLPQINSSPVDSILVPVVHKKNQNILQIRLNIQCVLNMSTAVPFKFFAKFSCFYCSKKFTEFDELKQHTSMEHPICDLKSKAMKKCKGERISVKIDISALSCKICNLQIPDLDVFVDHIIVEHKANYDKSIEGCLEPFKILKDNIPCPNCTERFRYFTSLLKHLNSKHNDNKRICDFCGRSFKNVSNLKAHLTYSHTGVCECSICGLKYQNQFCLARHRAKTHDAKDYKCSKCTEWFQSEYQKQKHMIKVHDIGHKCSYCGKMFTRNSFMKDHIRRTHLKEKNVPCSVCNEKFFDNHLLRMHMVKHDGERKFNCNVCGKAFLRRSNLCAHMEMHKKYGQVHDKNVI